MRKKIHEIESQMHRNKLIIYSYSLSQDNIYISVLYLQQLDYWMPKKGKDKNRELKEKT